MFFIPADVVVYIGGFNTIVKGDMDNFVVITEEDAFIWERRLN